MVCQKSFPVHFRSAAAAALIAASFSPVSADTTRVLTPEEQLNGVQPQKGLIDRAKDFTCGAVGWFCGDKGKTPPETKTPVKGHFVPPAYVPDNREFKGYDDPLVKPGELPVVPPEEKPAEASEDGAEDGSSEEDAGQGKFNVAPGQKDSSASKDSAGFQSVKGKAWTGKDAKPYKDPCPRSQISDGGPCRPMTTAEAAKSEADFARMRKEGKAQAPESVCKRGQKITDAGCKQMTAEEASAYELEFQKARKEGKVKSFEDFERMKLGETVKKNPAREPTDKTQYPEEVKALAKKHGLTEKQVYDNSVSEFKKLLDLRAKLVQDPRENTPQGRKNREDLTATIEAWKKENPFLRNIETESLGKADYYRTPSWLPPAKKTANGNSYNFVANGIETVAGRQVVHLKGNDGQWYQAELPKDMQGAISNGQQLSFESLRASGLSVKPRGVADAQEKWLKGEEERIALKKMPKVADLKDISPGNYALKALETRGDKQYFHLQDKNGKWYEAEVPKGKYSERDIGRELNFEGSGMTPKPRDIADAQEKWLKGEEERIARKDVKAADRTLSKTQVSEVVLPQLLAARAKTDPNSAEGKEIRQGIEQWMKKYPDLRRLDKDPLQSEWGQAVDKGIREAEETKPKKSEEFKPERKEDKPSVISAYPEAKTREVKGGTPVKWAEPKKVETLKGGKTLYVESQEAAKGYFMDYREFSPGVYTVEVMQKNSDIGGQVTYMKDGVPFVTMCTSNMPCWKYVKGDQLKLDP